MASVIARLNLHDTVVRFFSALARFAVRRPGTTIFAAVLVTVAAAPGARWLKLRTDGHALVAEDAPEVVYDKSIREKFGIQDQIVILIHTSGSNGIFNPGTLQL